MVGFILTLTALFLIYIFGPIGVITSFFFKTRSKYWMDVAISLDQFGNVTCQHLFNLTLITKRGYRFGKVDETISSVIGKNKVKGTLTWLGKALELILDWIDPNHSIKAIEHDE